jgi:hypothetical protein
MKMANKQTSPEVSAIAARLLKYMHERRHRRAIRITPETMKMMRTVCASVLTQDEISDAERD